MNRIKIIGNVSTKQKLQGNISTAQVVLYPELEDLTITPAKEIQNFKSNKYGYNNVKVNAIDCEPLSITPTKEEQSFNGMFDNVTINPYVVQNENLIVNPTGEQQNFTSSKDGYKNVIVNAVESENLNITPSEEEQEFNGIFNKVTVNKLVLDSLNITPSNEVQNFNGRYKTVNVEAIKLQEKSVVPTTEEQVISADDGYNGLSKVNVGASSGIDTSDATATAEDIAKDKTAYVNGKKITGKKTSDVIISPTEPTGDNRKMVWIQKGKNVFDASLYIVNLGNNQSKDGIYIKLKPNTVYTMSSTIPQEWDVADLFIASGKTTKMSTGGNGVWQGNPRTVTSDSEGYISIAYRKSDSNTIGDLRTYTYQIEEGAIATDYEEYIEIGMFVKNTNDEYVVPDYNTEFMT